MSSRNRELANLVLVAILGTAGFGSAWIGRHNVVSPRALVGVAAVAGIYLVAHVVTRFAAPLADPTLLPLAALLTAVGLTVNYRLDPADGRRQATWVALGVLTYCAVLIALRFDYRLLEKYKYLFGVSAIGLLLLPSIPHLGQRVNGVRLWIRVGSYQFQPGEIAKIFLVLFLAGYLRDKREALAQGRLKDFGPLLAIWGAAMLVIVETNDLGSALLNFGIFLGMLYVATGRVSYVVAGLTLFLGGAALLYTAIARVQERVTIWLHPWTDVKVFCPVNGAFDYRQNCQSYQLVKSFYSIAHGGFGGTGIGRGTFAGPDGVRLIPALNTDFIYSAIAQEIGLIGASAILLVFMVFVARGMRIALISQDGFSKLLASGLTFGLALQTFIILGGVLRVMPLTGITMPFVSYGGSSIIANFAVVALLLLVSQRAHAATGER